MSLLSPAADPLQVHLPCCESGFTLIAPDILSSSPKLCSQLQHTQRFQAMNLAAHAQRPEALQLWIPPGFPAA